MLNKQLLTASGQPVVLLGNYDDDSGMRVFLARDVEYAYSLNAAGTGMYTGTFKLDRKSIVVGLVDFEPKDEAFHSFDENALLTRQGSLYIGSIKLPDQKTNAIGAVSSYEELMALLAQH